MTPVVYDKLVLYGCAAETSIDVFWYVVQNFAIHAYIYELFLHWVYKQLFFSLMKIMKCYRKKGGGVFKVF